MICMFSVMAGICCAFTACGLKEAECQANSNLVGAAALPGNMLCVCFNRRLLFFAVLALVQQGVQMSTTMSFTTQIIKDLGADTMILGISCIIYMLSAVVWAKFVSTKFCSILSSKNWIFLVFCTTAGYCILVPMSTSIPVICLLQILPGMATGILFSFLTCEAMKGIPAEKKSTAMGCFQAIYALGMTVFPIICGKIAGAFSMTAAYLFLAVICVIAAVGSRVFLSGIKPSRNNIRQVIDSPA